VLFGRLIPLVRTFVSFPAGVAKMPFVQFTIYTLIGSAIWSAILSTAGFLLGEQWEQIIFWLSRYENFVIVASILFVVGYIVYKIFSKRAAKKH
jgi:membrane protein DedA with SNARE-associated domain